MPLRNTTASVFDGGSLLPSLFLADAGASDRRKAFAAGGLRGAAADLRAFAGVAAGGPRVDSPFRQPLSQGRLLGALADLGVLACDPGGVAEISRGSKTPGTG